LQTDITHNLEEPSLEELMRQLMINTMKSQQSINASLSKFEEKVGQFTRQVEDIAKNFDDTCATCVEMNKCILFDDMICTVDANITTPTLSNESECIDATIPIVFYVGPVDLHVVRIFEPLPTNVQPPLMEEKSLLNQEALDSMTHANKNNFVHHINTEDENVLEFLRDFNFYNPIKCTYDEIDTFLECTNSCDACLDREEDDIILPSLKLQRVQPPLFKVKPISLIPSSPMATPSIIIGTFESSLYQQPPPPNLYFIPSPTPTRPSTLARLSSLKPPPLDNPQTVNHIRSSILNKFTSSIYTLDNTIIHPWKKLYHFTRPPDPPYFHLLIQGLFVIACLFHSLPRYNMLKMVVAPSRLCLMKTYMLCLMKSFMYFSYIFCFALSVS